MAETWPPSLQDYVNEDNFGLKYGDTVLRSDMDVGPAKVRRRFTKGVDTMSISINLTTAQYTTFTNFYDITLNGGVKTFNLNHPITGILTEFRSAQTPDIRSLGGGQFRASWNLEILPQ
jgi:hypothetical protein